MTWSEAFEKGSCGGLVSSAREYKEAVAAWMAVTGTDELDPLSKWEGAGEYVFSGYLDEHGRGFVTTSKTKEKAK